MATLPGQIAQSNSAGIMPGSGVAQGGQQGRLKILNSGLSGNKKGGFFKGGSTGFRYLRTHDDGTASLANVTDAAKLDQLKAGKGPFNVIDNPFKSGMLDWKQRARPVVNRSANPSNPGDAFNKFKDGSYFTQKFQADRNLRDSIGKLEAERLGLTDTRFNNKTMYQNLLDRLQRSNVEQNRAAGSAFADQGLLRSGVRDINARDMSEAFQDDSLDLENKYGANRIEAIKQEQESLNAAHVDLLKQLGAEAANRAPEYI